MNIAAQIPDPWSLDLAILDPSDANLFEHQAHWNYFRRLREEDPVHFVDSEEFGPYWSITRFEDIVFENVHPLYGAMDIRRSSTPTKARSIPEKPSSARSNEKASASVWMAKAGPWTTSWSSAYGVR